MSNIRVDVSYTIQDGSEIVFRSPVDCSAVTGLIVYYPGTDGNTVSKVFALADAHGNNVGDIDHLFAENVVVKVILDVTESMAFVQNADTNAYLEAKFEKANQAAANAQTAAANAHVAANNANTAIGNHKEDKENPHEVTAAQVGATSMTLLWENASPTSDFAEQTLAIDWTPYDFLRVESNNDVTDVACKGNTCRLFLPNPYQDGVFAFAARPVYCTDGGLYFGDARYGSSNSGFDKTSVQNQRLIPLRIYGIKSSGEEFPKAEGVSF